MKLVLANLPWKSFGKKGVRAGSRWPHLKGPAERDYLPFPFFLAYAAALLKKHDFDVTLIDAIAEGISYRHFLKIIQKIKPHLLVCETSTVTLEHDLKFLARISKNIPIVLCGPDVNIRKPSFLKKYQFINYVLVGEYEFTLLDLAKHLNEGKKLGDVLGLIYLDSNGVKINSPRPISVLDELPWPLRGGLPMKRYNDTPGDMPLPSAQMLASRGCPYRCKFCLWPQVMYQGNNYRTRNTIDVVDEMEYLVKEINFKSIYFDDDTFNIGKQRMLRLCAEIKRRKLNVPWAIMARADLMDEEILEHMRDAGLYAVKYGVESATQELLDNINKNMDIKKTQRIIKFTKMLGIKTHLTFTFGLPGETKETIRKTIDLALNLDPTTIQFSILTPFPGTDFYQEMKEQGHLLGLKWAEYDGSYKSAICLDNLTGRDLEQAVQFAYKQWANHCFQKRQLNRVASGGYYYQLLVTSLKRYGLFITVLKIVRFFFRRLVLFLKEKLGYRRKELQKMVQEKGVRVGRLMLIFEKSGVALYWKGMKLTRNVGFFTSIDLQSGQSHQSSLGCWDFEKIGDNKLLLRTNYGILPVEEVWTISVFSEKQIDWHVDIHVKKDIEVSQRKVVVILSEKYRKWVDIWGEGYFPPLNDYKEVEIRNPQSSFIGLRGHKMLKGQMPTVLLEVTDNNSDFFPYVKNAETPLGAKILEVKAVYSSDNGRYAPGKHTFFSGRIKIVEEDFKKRRLQKK